MFQSARPVWGATVSHGLNRAQVSGFNPRAPCGARRNRRPALAILQEFQSARPVWGATLAPWVLASVYRFQSARPVWGATLIEMAEHVDRFVSIRAPRVGRDQTLPLGSRDMLAFQSARPVWGATGAALFAREREHVSIRAPRVGRDPPCVSTARQADRFNPRAPCGARHTSAAGYLRDIEFQSARPVWGATANSSAFRALCGFNPRAPCGARPFRQNDPQRWTRFQSARPVWGATLRVHHAKSRR